MKKEITVTIKFLGAPKKIRIERVEYQQNKEIALRSYDANTHEPFAYFSVWIEGLNFQEVAVKDWSENEGFYKELVEQNVVTEYHRTQPSGFVNVKVCLLGSAWEESE